MFVDFPQELVLMTASAFVLGYVLSWISNRISDRQRTKARDPRDVRIRELEAELRIARGEGEKAASDLEELIDSVKDMEDSIERRDNVITNQQSRLEQTTVDLRESVLKTRELRAELSERATENVRSEAKLREVETELSVARASTDLIATGVLDYSMTPDNEDEANEDPDADLSSSAK